ncbi:uncharacterized protein LOC127838251 isoform X2 [Dreissena polymorpha]|uniref:uncharacterized protein LOC127838251 isoform X2 n=1 Tax=Dreissena polymorpha TaxID=45954 RepID=UPI002264368E|nr:uncharacterized protein LOC127838251 isoform X2 [Dreissena polymorpha]
MKMAANTNIFSDKETNNWFKMCVALNITKEGLANFVENTIKKVHAPLGSSCGLCSIEQLMPCPTQGLCNKRKRNICSFHKSHLPQPCQRCDTVKHGIISYHRFSGPSWKNIKAQGWKTDWWEIAKCYLPPQGYADVSSVQESDFNAVINIILNCTDFQKYLSSSWLSPPPPDPQCPLEKLQNDRLPLIEFGNMSMSTIQAIERAKDVAEEQFSEKAKHTLEEGLNKIKEALKNGEQVIEQSIKTKTLVSITQIDTLTKSSVQLIEDHTKDSMARMQQNIADKAREDYERRVEYLRCRLVDHYRDTVSYVPLSALNVSLDKHVQDVYVIPKIHRIKIENDGRQTKQEQIFSYKDCFNGGDHLSRRIYLQGEPGSGKSTFASMLVNEWCNIQLPSTESTKEKTLFVDFKTLQKFKFLFFISLRDSRHHTDVVQMIKTQLIDKICTEDKREEAKKLCLQIMKNDVCLVIQDGLDEWPGDEALPSMAGIPKENCIVLTTSRPWKLSDERIKNSQIDILLGVEGISDTKAFNERILRCLLDESKDVKESVKQFDKFLLSRNLESISSSPMLHALVLCTWVDDRAKCLTGSSRCDLYTTLLDCLCKKATPEMCYFNKLNPPPVKNFDGTKYIKSNKAHIDSIAEAAFSFLFSNEKESSIVFSDIKLSEVLLPTAKEFALLSGLLTKRKAKRVTDTTCRFVHKTFQEFLTAYHIANNADVVHDVISGYLKRHDNSYLDIFQIFIFLCGLNISAANKLSALMNELAVNRNHMYMYGFFQKCILTGYREAVANKNTPIQLHLSHFNINNDNDAEELSQIWAFNKSRARSLWVYSQRIVVSICSRDALSTRCQESEPVSLPACDDPGPSAGTRKVREEISPSACCMEFDFSWCNNLERMILWCNAIVQPNSLVGLKKLKDLQLRGGCKCEALDLSHHEHMESINVSGGVTLLPLSVYNYKSLKCIKILTTYDGLDLSLLENLHSITISNKVKVLPKRPLIHNKQKLTHIGLIEFDLKSYDSKDSYTWCLLNGEDPVQCADYTPVLSSVALIELHGVTCSVNWLRSLLTTLLTLDHRVRCELSHCSITSLDHEVKGRPQGSHTGSCAEDADLIPDELTCASIDTDLNKTCAFKVNDLVWQHYLWETLQGLNVKKLSLRNLNQCFVSWYRLPPLSHSLASLPQLETLSVYLSEYIDLQLPPSLKHFIGSFYTLSPSQFRDLLNKLSPRTQSVECRLEFFCINERDINLPQKIPPEEYILIKKNLEALEHVKVKRFQLYEFALSTSTWSVRDSVGLDGDDDDEGIDYSLLSDHEAIDGLARISMGLQINCVKDLDLTE